MYNIVTDVANVYSVSYWTFRNLVLMVLSIDESCLISPVDVGMHVMLF